MENDIYLSDGIEMTKSMPNESIDLVICDGPIVPNIQEYNLELLKQFNRVLKCGGVLYLFGKPNCVDFIDYKKYFQLNSKIVWYQPSRLSQGRISYTNNYDIICYFSKGSPKTFNLDAIRVPQLVELEHRKRIENSPSVKAGKYGKTKFNDDGKNPGDVWGDIKQLTYRSNELVSRDVLNTIQKPEKLIERLVLASSNPGDLIFDPFSGSGTVSVIAKKHDRKFIACDDNPKFVEMSKLRLAGKLVEIDDDDKVDNINIAFPDKRILVWFSCGAASACTAKITLEKYPNAEVLYCDTFAYEHPDNRRFFDDVEKWIGKKITVLHSKEYTDIYDVFTKTKWLVGHGMARCSIELKRALREEYQQKGDIHAFGFTFEETARIERFKLNNPEIYVMFPLQTSKVSKDGCLDMLKKANIEIPMMYKLGYKNNNCIGCVKGGRGYWSKIRKDFPEAFSKMVNFERQINTRIFKDIWLDDLPITEEYNEEDVECGVTCPTR